MSVGPSGRVVIEVDPVLKREVYAALSNRGLTLKQWFILQAEELVATGDQLSLTFPSQTTPTDRKRKDAS